MKTPESETLPIIPVIPIRNETLHRLESLNERSLIATADWEPLSQNSEALGAINVTSPVSQEIKALNHSCWKSGPNRQLNDIIKRVIPNPDSFVLLYAESKSPNPKRVNRVDIKSRGIE